MKTYAVLLLLMLGVMPLVRAEPSDTAAATPVATPSATPDLKPEAAPSPEAPEASATPSPSPTPAQGEEVDETETAIRSAALEVAGAFANDGFKTRDGHWLTSLEPGKAQVLQVNLFAGNQYWFIAAAAEPAKKISVSLHDEKGKAVVFEPYQDATRAAAGFSPMISGPYYVRILLEEGDAAKACLIYSYQ